MLQTACEAKWKGCLADNLDLYYVGEESKYSFPLMGWTFTQKAMGEIMAEKTI